jgi:hypothetical protein
VEALSSAEALVVLVGYDYDEIHFTTLYFTWRILEFRQVKWWNVSHRNHSQLRQPKPLRRRKMWKCFKFSKESVHTVVKTASYHTHKLVVFIPYGYSTNLQWATCQHARGIIIQREQHGETTGILV